MKIVKYSFNWSFVLHGFIMLGGLGSVQDHSSLFALNINMADPKLCSRLMIDVELFTRDFSRKEFVNNKSFFFFFLRICN